MCSAFASARRVHAHDRHGERRHPCGGVDLQLAIRARLAARLAGPSKPRLGTQQPTSRNQNTRAGELRARHVPILTFFLISPVQSSNFWRPGVVFRNRCFRASRLRKQVGGTRPPCDGVLIRRRLPVIALENVARNHHRGIKTPGLESSGRGTFRFLCFSPFHPSGQAYRVLHFFSCLPFLNNAQNPLSHSASLLDAQNSLLAVCRDPSLPSDLPSFSARNVACAAPATDSSLLNSLLAGYWQAAKQGDEFTVPLCRMHHREVHRVGNEEAWWGAAGIDPLSVAHVVENDTRG